MNKLAKAFLSVTLFTSSAFISSAYAKIDITGDQIMERLEPMLSAYPETKNKKFDELNKDLQQELRTLYVRTEVVPKKADLLKIRESESYKKKAKLSEFQILQDELLHVEVRDKITDKDVEAAYNKRSAELKGQDVVKTAHILVETEEKAKEIKKKLNKGANFTELAKTLSKDESSKVNGGEIDYVLKGQLVKAYEDKAFSLKKGEISDPVQTQHGWHVIKLIDRKPVEIPKKEQAELILRENLYREGSSKYLEDLMKEAKNDYNF